MATVTYLGESYSCATAYKGEDFIHLVDADGQLIVAFDGIAEFEDFSITDGSWATLPATDDSYLAVIKEDGTLGKGSHKCCDIPTTHEDIGAAPAGYGLGEAIPRRVNSLDEITTSGYYRMWLDTANGDPIHGWATFTAITNGEYNNVHIQGKIGGGYVHRDKWDGTWGAWEWVNPPLTAGVEYRTTERINGVAVYKKSDANGKVQYRLDGSATWFSLSPSDYLPIDGTAYSTARVASGVVTVQLCGQWTGEIAKSGYTSKKEIAPTTRSGYTFLYPVAFGSNSSYFCCYGLYYTGGKLQLYGRNIKDEAITATVDIYGLYVKN